MRKALLFAFLLFLASCDTVVHLVPQHTRFTPPEPKYRKIGLYIKNDPVPSRLHASINGEPLHSGGITIVIEDAVHESVRNALAAVSEDVIMLDTLPTLPNMKRLGLDAAFWIDFFNVRSQLQREGTLIPSYTTYSNVSMRLKRMSGFRGTIDSLDVTGFGSFSLYITGSARSRLAKQGAELALQDLVTRLAQRLSSNQLK